MKLPIKKEYFDEIKAGKKEVEWRDAHITFVCEETGEEVRKEVVSSHVCRIYSGFRRMYPGCFDDDYAIEFQLSDKQTEP